MQIVSTCPLRAGSLLFMPAAGRYSLSLAVKATFTLAPGRSPPAEQQEGINEGDNHWDDDPQRSLYAPSDLVPLKRKTDVVLVGSAAAPLGKPVRSILTRLAVGEIDKVIEVVGPRLVTREGELREGPPWTSMPVRYERAAGGPGTWNPVGVSPEGAVDVYGQRSLPNLQPPGQKPGEHIPPVGFGPIAPTWWLRREKLRHRAEPPSAESLRRTPLDEDFDPAYFQAALPDQQLRELPPESTLLLENLHKEHPRLVTQLPALRPRVFVDLGSAAPFDLPMTADLLWIDTDRGICTLTYRGLVPLPRPDHPGRVVVAMEEGEQRLSWAEVRGAAERAAPAPLKPPGARRPQLTKHPLDESEKTAAHVRPEAQTGVLPFQPAEGVPPAPPAPAQSASPSLPGPPPPRRARRDTMPMAAMDSAAALPAWMIAQRDGPPPAPPPPEPQLREPARSTPPPPLLVTAPAPSTPPPPLVPAVPSLSAERPATFAPVVVPAPRPALDKVNLGEVNEGLLAQATLAGLLATSNAASPVSPAAPRAQPASEGAAAHGPMLELLWLDPADGPRVQRTARWEAHLKPPPPRKPPVKGAPPAPPDPPDLGARVLRADVGRVLSSAAPSSVAELGEAMSEALRGEGLWPALCLVEGELELGLDEAEVLRATITAAMPLGASDKKLKETLELAVEMQKGDLAGAPEIVEGLTAKVRDAWSKANRQLPGNHLEARAERALLEQRRYQRRELLDGSFLRAALRMEGGAALPLYLAAAAAGRLPLFRRFPARAIVEVLPPQDPADGQPLALRAAALARVVGATR